MNKTKLGISANAFAAMIFLAGLFGILPVIVMTGAVLLLDESDWLKRMAVKALAFILMLEVLSAFIGILGSCFNIFENLFSMLPFFTFSFFNGFISVLNSIVSILTKIGLLIYALLSYKGKYAKVPLVENLINKNM
ncbi:MAG: hypothetical protein IJB48_00290 [Clostridia bacterium]|nr:hypothetical protein [Clostridia bacterium]MBQ3554165.1 hypothetical protein [Clostridia bacterium]